MRLFGWILLAMVVWGCLKLVWLVTKLAVVLMALVAGAAVVLLAAVAASAVRLARR
jgi:hypothetical protein